MSPAKKRSARKKTASKKKASTKKANPRKASANRTVARKSAGRKAPAERKPAPAAKASGTKKKATKSAAKKTAGGGSRAKEAPSSKAAANRSSPSKKGTASRKKAAGTGGSRPQTSRSRARPPKFDARTLDGIKGRLLKERADLQKQITEIDEESFEGTQSDLTGEVALDEDFADAGTATFDRERALSIRNNIRDLIDQISRALRRIEDGVYGTCERCGRPIEAARLKALPHASLCMDCKRREERAR